MTGFGELAMPDATKEDLGAGQHARDRSGISAGPGKSGHELVASCPRIGPLQLMVLNALGVHRSGTSVTNDGTLSPGC